MISHNLNVLGLPAGVEGLLGWDEMTIMPEGSAGARATQKAALAGARPRQNSWLQPCKTYILSAVP